VIPDDRQRGSLRGHGGKQPLPDDTRCPLPASTAPFGQGGQGLAQAALHHQQAQRGACGQLEAHAPEDVGIGGDHHQSGKGQRRKRVAPAAQERAKREEDAHQRCTRYRR